jgi:site-specific DNA recombinase
MEKTLVQPYPVMNTTVVPKKAAIYIRCSSDEAKKEGYSPETQKEKVEKAIKEYGWQINKNNTYSDIGFSGGVDKRPGLQRLLKDAKNKEFDVLVVYRMDRFFRNLRLLLNTVAELRELGIEFKSVTEPFDTSTPTGRAMFANVGVFAEWMREIGLESRNEGMIKAMRAGKWLGGTPTYGCRLNKKAQRLEIDEKEILVVKMIFHWLVNEKLSEYKIQQRINTMKIPTKYDRLKRKKKTGSKCWWNRRTIDRILRNPIYTGVYYYRKHKYLGRVKGRGNLRPKEEWIKVENPDLKVISKSLFEKAQQQLKKNKELSWRNTKQAYILQHKIVCGFDNYRYQCGRRVYKSKKTNEIKQTKYYFCTGNRSYFTSKKCVVPTISESRIVPPVWSKLKEILSNPEIIMSELEEYRKRKNQEEKIKQGLEGIKKRLTSYENKKERYAELYGEGSIKKEFYDKKMIECDKEIEELQKEEVKLSQIILSEEEKEKRIKSVESLYNQLKESLENTTYEIKRQVVQLLVEKVIKTDDKLEIEFNIPLIESSPEFNLVDCRDSRRMG